MVLSQLAEIIVEHRTESKLFGTLEDEKTNLIRIGGGINEKKGLDNNDFYKFFLIPYNQYDCPFYF